MSLGRYRVGWESSDRLMLEVKAKRLVEIRENLLISDHKNDQPVADPSPALL